MLTRILQSNSTTITIRQVNNIRLMDSIRHKSHHSNEVDHHDPYKIVYERLWRQKATLDWLPKPTGDWQELNGKKQTYYNKILASGVIAFAVALIYLRTVIISRSGALTKSPYHLIGLEDFLGSKYDDATSEHQAK